MTANANQYICNYQSPEWHLGICLWCSLPRKWKHRFPLHHSPCIIIKPHSFSLWDSTQSLQCNYSNNRRWNGDFQPLRKNSRILGYAQKCTLASWELVSHPEHMTRPACSNTLPPTIHLFHSSNNTQPRKKGDSANNEIWSKSWPGIRAAFKMGKMNHWFLQSATTVRTVL